MEPNRLGRVLGIGARVAAKTIRERAAQAGQAAGPGAAGAVPADGDGAQRASSVADPGFARPGVSSGDRSGAKRTAAKSAGVAAADGGRRLARGAGRFGAAMLQPVARASSILALQISGVFFAIFALFFLNHAWEAHRTLGWHDAHTRVYAALGVAFTWFAVSSFWRARRKEQR
jgi:hypothetical protein